MPNPATAMAIHHDRWACFRSKQVALGFAPPRRKRTPVPVFPALFLVTRFDIEKCRW